ncbi:hypothetical protein [Tunturiibacter gelidoferens]|uniref:Uncharacterized protein n=1 Tax=Tunturiibacter gelidiferens TaxID=3069689 RepID=A0ACC5P0J5_9BACT|nr:hypothetical protein [Edaphobacter lichenicola]MBB5340342.1 hypothetical protein [Edaphobacter lichenicola]
MRTIFALLLAITCLPAVAQSIEGSTTIQIDPNSSVVTATCETNLGSADDGYYAARILCTVKDSSGNTLASGAYSDDGDRQGFAAVTLSFTGIPGTTYTATGQHTAALTVPFDAPPGEPQGQFYDEENFETYAENPQTYINNNSWFGPGPEKTTKARSLHIGNTYAQATAPQIPTSLKLISATVLPTGITNNSGCAPTADYGIKLDIKYQVLDQSGKPILQSGMTPYEAVQSAGGNLTYNPVGPTQNSNSSATTASDGTFHDVPFGICSAATFANANILQIIYINSQTYKVRQNSFTVGSTGLDHGSITNSNDVTASR